MALGAGTHCPECAEYHLGKTTIPPHGNFNLGVKMATMEIGSWNTTCSECRRETGWTPTHETNYGYDMKINGTPGCGAEFTGIRFVYMNVLMPDDPRVDNDRYPQWMKDLPLV